MGTTALLALLLATPDLTSAIERGDEASAARLLDTGTPADEGSLYSAVYFARPGIAALLMSHGARFEFAEHTAWSPARCATIARARTRPVSPAQPARSAASEDGVCFIDGRDSIVCWRNALGGWTAGGKFLYDPREHKPGKVTPAVVRFEAPGVQEVALGAGHVCVRSKDRVRCWGDDEVGSFERNGVSAMASGDRHVCLVSGDGRVECLGATAAPPFEKARLIAAGKDFTCASREDGSVGCWGSLSMHRVEGPAVQLVAGPGHACMLTATGEVSCWGDLWESTTTSKMFRLDKESEASRVRCLSGDDELEQLVAGGKMLCARMRSGETQCLGEGASSMVCIDIPEGRSGISYPPPPWRIEWLSHADAFALGPRGAIALANGGYTAQQYETADSTFGGCTTTGHLSQLGSSGLSIGSATLTAGFGVGGGASFEPTRTEGVFELNAAIDALIGNTSTGTVAFGPTVDLRTRSFRTTEWTGAAKLYLHGEWFAFSAAVGGGWALRGQGQSGPVATARVSVGMRWPPFFDGGACEKECGLGYAPGWGGYASLRTDPRDLRSFEVTFGLETDPVFLAAPFLWLR